jgi:hypothetical protein
MIIIFFLESDEVFMGVSLGGFGSIIDSEHFLLEAFKND